MSALRETDYVERAFFAGWLDALGHAMDEQEMTTMCDSLRDQCAELVREYVESLNEEEDDE